MNVKLTESQITDLARPLKGILQKFYEDPKNREAFEKWLRVRENGNSKEDYQNGWVLGIYGDDVRRDAGMPGSGSTGGEKAWQKELGTADGFVGRQKKVIRIEGQQ